MRAIANINGVITPYLDAKISISDRGFLYGDSVYEVIRTYGGVPFYADEHFERLKNSARLALMPLSQSTETLRQEIKRTVAESAPQRGEDIFIRYTITRGTGPLDLDPATAEKTSFIIVVKELPQWNPRFVREGVFLAIPATRRNSPLALDPNIKGGNYLNNIIAVSEAKKLGADDALLLSIEGKLTEASNSNVSFIIDGEVHSPLHEPFSSTGNLKGITKKIVAKIAGELGINYLERPLTEEDIQSATECFVSSATREVMPVVKIRLANGNLVNFPAGGGELTKKLQNAYKAHIEDYKQRHRAEALF